MTINWGKGTKKNRFYIWNASSLSLVIRTFNYQTNIRNLGFFALYLNHHHHHHYHWLYNAPITGSWPPREASATCCSPGQLSSRLEVPVVWHRSPYSESVLVWDHKSLTPLNSWSSFKHLTRVLFLAYSYGHRTWPAQRSLANLTNPTTYQRAVPSRQVSRLA